MRSKQLEASSRLIFLCYLFSGIAGLIYEVVWVRLFHLVFGVTHEAVALVLAVYMGAMALGGWWGGKKISQTASFSPLRFYAVAEISIGLYALAIPFFFRRLESLYPFIYHLSGRSSTALAFTQIIGPVFLIGLPTFAMGLTFPALVSQLTGSEKDPFHYRKIVGVLYSVNLLGAVAGCLLAGFFLIPSFGLSRTNYLGVAFSLGAGGLAWFLSLELKIAPDLLSRQDVRTGFGLGTGRNIKSFGFRRWFGIALLATGAFSFGLQVLFTRLLSLIVNNTCYAFSTVLAVFLSGLFLGGGLASRLKFAYQKLSWGMIWGAVGLYSLIIIPLGKPIAQQYLDRYFQTIERAGAVPWGLVFSAAAAVILIPALLIGLAYPLGISLYYSGEEAAGSVASATGTAYAYNTAGAVIGTLGIGFFLIPGLGTQTSLIIIAVGCLLTGVFMAVSETELEKGGKIAWAAGLVFLFVLASPFTQYDLTFKELVSDKTIFAREDNTGLIEVLQRNQKVKVLISNRQQQEGDTSFRSLVSQRRQGYLPILLHPDPKSALLIGLGTGISHAAYIIYPFKEITCVELSSAVVEAGRFFRPYNRDFIHDKRVDLKIEDGRNFLMVTDRKFDLIIGDLFSPYRPGVGNLYTEEHFQNCRGHLNQDGIFCQWLPPQQLSPSTLKSIIKSFSRAFPEGSLWLTRQSLALIGRRREIRVDYSKLQKKMKLSGVRQDLADYGLSLAHDFLSLYIGKVKDLTHYLENTPLNTDDRPFVEFETPKYLHLLEGGELYYRNLAELLPLMVPFDNFFPLDLQAVISVKNRFQARQLRYQERLNLWKSRRKL